MYYLTAEYDSENYQLRGQRDITRDDVRADGLRLWNQVHTSGTMSSVTWKSLRVRAERLSGPAID